MKRTPWYRRLEPCRQRRQETQPFSDIDEYVSAWLQEVRQRHSARTVAVAGLLAAVAEPYPAASRPNQVVVRLDPDRRRRYALHAHMRIVGFQQHLRRLAAANLLDLTTIDAEPGAVLTLSTGADIVGAGQPPTARPARHRAWWRRSRRSGPLDLPKVGP